MGLDFSEGWYASPLGKCINLECSRFSAPMTTHDPGQVYLPVIFSLLLSQRLFKILFEHFRNYFFSVASDTYWQCYQKKQGYFTVRKLFHNGTNHFFSFIPHPAFLLGKKMCLTPPSDELGRVIAA